MVTHRPQENVANVVSFAEGYPLKDGSTASLDIDGTHFELFTKGDTAWSRTSDLDKTIVKAMAKGRQAILKATPQKGPPTSDSYSLSGFCPDLGADRQGMRHQALARVMASWPARFHISR